MRSHPSYNITMPDPNIQRVTQKNLIHIIKSSVGSDIFRHTYVRHIDGHEFDALEDGDKSCAFHTSGVLSLVDLIDRPHATVETTIAKMLEAGWQETKDPIAGCVVFWPVDDQHLSHTGFYIDDNTYISNSSDEKQPIVHGRQMKDGRQPSKFYMHPLLGT